jgi:hypothetical protein
MRHLAVLLAGLILTGCSVSAQHNENEGLGPLLGTTMSLRVELPDLGLAPELKNEIWLNTSEPIRLADLRGKVVLLEFWTFG